MTGATGFGEVDDTTQLPAACAFKASSSVIAQPDVNFNTSNFDQPENRTQRPSSEEKIWRPRSGDDILLSDRELAKIGLYIQYKSQCRVNLSIALKGAASLTLSEWLELENV